MESYESLGFDDWVRVTGNRFVPLSLATTVPEQFLGTIHTRTVGDTSISHIAASAHSVHRLSHSIRAGQDNHLKLSMQLEGTGTVIQDGRIARLEPGDAAIYDTSRPYTLEYGTNMRSLVMFFPHSNLGLSASMVHTVTASRLAGDQGIGRVICPFMQHMAENLELLDGTNGVRILQSAYELITALISAEIQTTVPPEDSRVAFESVRMYIDQHLADPELNTDMVARAHYVSTRQLQYLFQEEGTTVSRYIRSRRLERCRIDLEDSALQERKVLQIAQAAGFTDLSHFSKLFKTTYGVTPSEHRLHQTHN